MAMDPCSTNPGAGGWLIRTRDTSCGSTKGATLLLYRAVAARAARPEAAAMGSEVRRDPWTWLWLRYSWCVSIQLNNIRAKKWESFFLFGWGKKSKHSYTFQKDHRHLTNSCCFFRRKNMSGISALFCSCGGLGNVNKKTNRSKPPGIQRKPRP